MASEAVELVGGPIESVADMRDAARRLAALGPEAVLVKGGHRPGPDIVDVLSYIKSTWSGDARTFNNQVNDPSRRLQ